MTNFFKYSNGTGILIMSILIFLGGLTLVILPWLDLPTRTTGLGFLISVVTYWITTSSANAAARAMVTVPPSAQANQILQPPTSTPGGQV
jgi:hypothetical protein